MEKIVLASNNKHKIKEFKEIFADAEVLSLRDVGFYDDIIEDGETFYDNSLIKARAVADFLKERGVVASVIADDSGLCVEALGGEPGVYSARYSGDHDDAKNREKLLERLNGVEDRTAYFLCALVELYPNGEHIVAEGRTYGKITLEEIGDKTFGYDCLFLSDDLNKTFGEASADEKNLVSHRGRAVEKLKQLRSKFAKKNNNSEIELKRKTVCGMGCTS